jgi:GAF domain-containing protein
MLIGEELIGMLALDKQKPDFYTSAHAKLAEAFAAQAAIAIENSRLFQSERDQRGLAEALVKAAAAVNSSLDLDDVLDRILEQVAYAVDGDAFNIMLRQGDYASVVRWLGYETFGDTDIIAHLRTPLDNYPILLTMVELRKPIVLPIIAMDENWKPKEKWAWMKKAYVGAPIIVDGETVGFLNVDGMQYNQFDQQDAQRLSAFASHVASAVRNAQLHRELQEYAGQLERRVRDRTVQLQAQYARLDAILRSTADGIIVTDEAGSILQTNPVAKAWLQQISAI